MKKYIKGNYKRSIFKSEKGYIIGLFKIKDTNDENMTDYINETITFTGYFYDLKEDDNYIFYGEFIEHPKYGFQYQVTEFEKVKPEGRDGIIEFLSSDLFTGVGVKQAESIVNILGENALDKILEDPSCLLLVPKLTSKKMDKIYSILTTYEESHKTIVYLNDLGFSMKDSLSIYNKYKKDTFSIIEHNIFRLVDEVEDISFIKIDELSKLLNIKENDERRVKALIIYIMKKITYKTGDTYMYKNEIISEVILYLGILIDETLFDNYFKELELIDKIVIDNNKYYLKELYLSENNIVNKINLLNKLSKSPNKKIVKNLKELEIQNNIIYNDKQKEAIIKSLENNITIITGGPGTGKTTIIKAITELYSNINSYNYDELIEKVALLAPTGRASKRMSESTLLPASTIHRFLKWNKETNEFNVNEENKDHSNLIIVDEVSMIDINLLDSLFKGLTDNIKIVLVGDYNQLPSVGPGQILKDLIESNKIDVIKLDTLYRQDENSYITKLAYEIKDNTLTNYLDTKSDYTFLKCSSDSIKHNLEDLCIKLNEKGYDYKRVQIMAPMYAGMNGIDSLNKLLQKVFNKKDKNKKEIIVGDVIYRENDKILQLVNMPDENVYNGDIGVVKQIISSDQSESKKNEIYVDYDGNVVKYLPKDFNKIKHGFIISIHKSQGSEFELVILPLSVNYKRMLYRKLIYTAVTRAKKKLILLGEENAFLYSVNNEGEYKRKTSLLEKLIKSE